MPHRRRTLQLERLESRALLTAVGWDDPRHLTLSWAPDGTPIAGHTSDLFEKLDGQMSRQVWQHEFLRALQAWSEVANVSIGLHGDDGSPLGTPGRVQHDGRFGDIRIASQSMSPEALSISVLPDALIAGTWAGDILLNSDVSFDGERVDLFSVALHEVGHALGLGDSDDPNSVLFSQAARIYTGLAPSDIAAIQSLYGVRSPDANDLAAANDSLASATPIQIKDDFAGQFPFLAFGDVTTAADADFFTFEALHGHHGPMSVRVQTAGISLLNAQLTVFNAAGQLVASAVTAADEGGIATVHFDNVAPQDTFYVAVQSVSGSQSSVGRFGLAVSFDDRLAVSAAAIDAALRTLDGLKDEDVAKYFAHPGESLFNDDKHTDDEPGEAFELKSDPGYPKNTHYTFVASLADGQDTDVYRIESPATLPADGVLVGTVRAAQANGTTADLEVLDEDRHVLPARILAHDGQTLTIQISGVAANKEYLVRLVPRSAAAGNYELEMTFRAGAYPLVEFSAAAVTPTRVVTNAFYVAQNQVFYFLLNVNPVSGSAASVRMEVLDTRGHRLWELTSPAGQTRSAQPLFLLPGEYRIRYTYQGPAGDPAGVLPYQLWGAVLSDPVGPALGDPTLRPIYTSGAPSGMYAYPGGVISTTPFSIQILVPNPKPPGRPTTTRPPARPPQVRPPGVNLPQVLAGSPVAGASALPPVPRKPRPPIGPVTMQF